MKNVIMYIAVFFITMGSTQQLSAQTDFNPEKNNYLVLTQKIQQLKPILLTAKDLKEGDGDNYGEFQVVICGKTVNELTDSKTIDKLLKEAKEEHVKIFVCGLSLSKFNIDPSALPQGVDDVKNGILYGFQLKKNGFLTNSL